MEHSPKTKTHSFQFPYIFLVLNLLLVIGVYFFITRATDRALISAITISTQAGNSAVTRIFINEVYPQLHQDLMLTHDKNRAKPELFPQELKRVDDRVRQFMFGTDILKAKIYNINGITLYSSDPSQIGDDKSGNLGFDSAAKGVPASQVTHRGKFSALDGEVFKRDLVASYIPIRDKDDEIIGVAEIYTDRSNVIRHADELIVDLKTELIPLLAIILLVIAVIVWRFTSFVTQLHIERNLYTDK